MSNAYINMEPFLGVAEAERMLRIAESFGSFGTYSEEGTSEGLGESLPQRFDAALNYLEHGLDGAGNEDDQDTAVSRTNYFRETYAYGDEKRVDGIEPFMEHPQMQAAAREISGCGIVVPAIVYANLLVPGQELAIHTDVPEFRGANRMNMPQWLLVCMLHSGLFERWRVPILTCVSWFGAAGGGAFTFFPDGAQGARQSILARHNSAILVDTDRVFHGVERVAQRQPDIPVIQPGTRLHFLGGEGWELRSAGGAQANYQWRDIRYSISWKGYCFTNEAGCRTWQEHSDDISLEQILDIFEHDLQARGLIGANRPGPDEFALQMVQTYIRFPGAAVAT